MIPSLLQIPSAVSDSKLHSVLPNNGKGDFQFDRSTGATRINKDGLIEEVGYFSSELVQNGNFSELGSELIPSIATITNAGGGTITQISGNTYSSTSDGTSGSSIRPKIDFATTSGKTYKLIITPIGTVTGTINFKFYDGSSYIFQNYDFSTVKEIYFTDNGNVFGAFDGTETYNINSFIISVKQVDPNDRWTLGTGWVYGANKISNTGGANFSDATQNNSNIIIGNTYKVSYTISNYTSGSIKFIMNNNSATGVERNANGNYVDIIVPNSQGYSIRTQGSGFVGDISNISVVEVQGDRARLSYDITNGVVEDQPHLLLENSSTNLVTFSEDFSQSVWNTGTSRSYILTTTNDINPTGLSLSYKFKGTAIDNQFAYIHYTTIGTTITNSIYVKRVLGTGEVKLRDVNNSNTDFNLSVADGWKRISVTAAATSTTARFYLNLATIGDEILIFGAQQEALSYATSYIPTAGTTITRAAETCNNSKPSVNSTEGVFYCEIQALAADSTNKYIALSDGSLSNRVNIFFDASNVLRGFVTGISSMPTSATITDFNKIALKYKSGDISLFLNGSEVATKTDSISLSGLNTVAFDNGGGSIFYGKVKGLAVYNEALTDAQLITLTS